MGKEVWDVCYFYLLTNQIGEVMWYAHNTTKKKTGPVYSLQKENIRKYKMVVLNIGMNQSKYWASASGRYQPETLDRYQIWIFNMP